VGREILKSGTIPHNACLTAGRFGMTDFLKIVEFRNVKEND
jgi:hypothetical protein